MFDMCLTLDPNAFLSHLNDDDSEAVQMGVEKILELEGVEIDKNTEQEGFYSIEQVNEVLDDIMPNEIDFNTVIELIFNDVQTRIGYLIEDLSKQKR